jgi:2,3-bisphosphoglycerate-dependent phosphoglycerate mutase
MLILVRHAMPAAGPDLPPSEWPLSPEGVAAAAALRELLPRDARLVASSEQKAWQTLGGSGVADDPVGRDRRFREIDRVTEPWADDFRARRAEYVAGASHPGWEPQADVARRFAEGVATHVDGPRPLVIASHGMAMTVWLVSVGVVAGADAEAFWQALRFPDAHIVDLDARTVRRWPPAAADSG